PAPAALRRRPLVVRFAGDRFAVLLDEARPVRVLRRVLRLLMRHLLWTAISLPRILSRLRSARRVVIDLTPLGGVCYGCGANRFSHFLSHDVDREVAMAQEAYDPGAGSPSSGGAPSGGVGPSGRVGMSRRRMLTSVGAAVGAAVLVPRLAGAQTPPSGPVAPPSTVTQPPRDFSPRGAPTTYFTDPDVLTVEPAANAQRHPTARAH